MQLVGEPPMRILQSTFAAGSIGALVAARHGIAVAEARLLRRGFNDTYLLTTTDGERLVARLGAPDDQATPSVAHETRFLVRLADAGVAVPRPLADATGAHWTGLEAPEGRRALVVSQFIAGRPWQPSSAAARAIGRTLAHVHALGQVKAAHVARRLDAAHLIDGPAAALEKIGYPHPVLAVVARQLTGELREALAEQGPSLAWGHCHGDSHAGNAVMRGGTDAPAAYLIDFADGGWGPLAYDLATFRWGLEVAHPLRRFWSAPRLWRSFLQGYRSVQPLARADLDAVGLFTAVRSLWLLGEYARRAEVSGDEAFSEALVAKQLRIARRAFRPPRGPRAIR